MKYKIPTETPKHVLLSAALPQNTNTYTVVPYKVVIDKALKSIEECGFKVIRENYRATKDCAIAHGTYYIEPLNGNETDPDLGITFNWTNSYNKMVKFNCCIGGYVKLSNNVILPENINYSRKHTGVALYDIDNQITNQLKNAQNILSNIISQKEYLKTVTLTEQQQAELLGRLYYIEDVLDIRHVSAIKDQIKLPIHHFNLPDDNAWLFYNNVLQVIKKAHPIRWMYVLSKFHDFMVTNVVNNTQTEQPKVTIIDDEPVPEQKNVESLQENIESNIEETVDVVDLNDDFEFEL